MRCPSCIRSAAICALLLVSSPTLAQTATAYPTKPIHLVVPDLEGGSVAVVARTLRQKLGEAFGQSVEIDYRPGGETNIGSAFVAKAAPDGYTLLMGTTANALNASFYKNMPYDLVKDLTPVILIGTSSNVLLVNPSLPIESVSELIALAKSKPGELTYASDGTASFSHLSGELFKTLTGTNIAHVPYQGPGPAVIDLLSGKVTIYFSSIPRALPFTRISKLHALGVTGARRPALAPDLQTLAEAGVPGYELVGWYGMLAPAGTPQDILSKLNAEIARVLKAPEARVLIVNEGIDPVGNTPAEFGAFLKDAIVKYGKIVRSANITVGE